MTYQSVILEKENGIATLTLNRPDKLNAIDNTMREELPKALDEVSVDNDVRVLILTGAGRGFCSGANITQLAARITGDEQEKTRRETLAVAGAWALALAKFGKPAIAAVNGIAAGGGLSLALLCDIRIAAESARFMAVWARRGLVADAGATYLLPRLLGVSKALEFMYTGDTVNADEAERIGLVSRVVPDADMMKASRELATKLAAGPPIALELMKRAVYRDILSGLVTALDFETYAQNLCRSSEDHKEGVSAFLEKREAQFKGM